MARRSELWVCIGAILTLSILVVACGGQTAPAAAPTYPDKNVIFYAISKPGSGFDATARAVAATIEKEKLLPPGISMPVENGPGGVPGTAVMFNSHKNDPYYIAVSSTAGLINKATRQSDYGHQDFVNLANLISVYYGYIVRADSPYKNVLELMKDLKEKPDQTPVSGGTSDDRFPLGASGIVYGFDLTKVRYAAFDSGGTGACTAVLEGSSKACITTIDDVMGLIEGGKLRVLASSGDKRMTGTLSNVPTFKEAGLDLEWTNFRFVYGGPGFPADAKKYWQAKLQEMTKTPTWKETTEKLRWGENVIVDNLDAYLDEKYNIIEKVAIDLGMRK